MIWWLHKALTNGDQVSPDLCYLLPGLLAFRLASCNSSSPFPLKTTAKLCGKAREGYLQSSQWLPLRWVDENVQGSNWGRSYGPSKALVDILKLGSKYMHINLYWYFPPFTNIIYIFYKYFLIWNYKNLFKRNPSHLSSWLSKASVQLLGVWI